MHGLGRAHLGMCTGVRGPTRVTHSARAALGIGRTRSLAGPTIPADPGECFVAEDARAPSASWKMKGIVYPAVDGCASWRVSGLRESRDHGPASFTVRS